ncbi:MAG: hypothetical protein K5695_01500 [Oscillospiraceae bacterium]|nr:hypothetical protein [Oscillospiraceae bacterium]
MDKDKTLKQMRLVIPAMILCLIGDYCIGIEPADSTEIGMIARSGWLTISDLRIAISNICGMIGTFLFGIGAVAFMKWLSDANKHNESKWDNRFLRLFYFSLCIGCISFIYIHIAVGDLIQHYNVLYELSGHNAEAAEAALLRMFKVDAVPFTVTFVLFDLLVSISWVGLILRKVIDLPKIWMLAAPLLTAAIGQILELIPLPFKGIGSGFETLGWMLIFVGGIMHIRKCKEG